MYQNLYQLKDSHDPILTRLERRYIPEPNSGCWIWVGSTARGGGRGQNLYGRMSTNGKDELAHRIAYMFFKGLIPDNLEIDHVCNNTLCINPDHLQAIPHIENLRRALSRTCIRGHLLEGENLLHPLPGKRAKNRICRICHTLHKERCYDLCIANAR